MPKARITNMYDDMNPSEWMKMNKIRPMGQWTWGWNVIDGSYVEVIYVHIFYHSHQLTFIKAKIKKFIVELPPVCYIQCI